MPLYSIDGVSPELPPDGEYFIAPNAVLIGRVRLLRNASVWFGAVLRGDNDWITLGEGSNVQDNAVLHTDPGQPIVLGAGVTVGHSATIHSARVGDHALIGMGATLLNGAIIGAYSVVGANALVPEGRAYSEGSLIVGAPGRVIRTLNEEQRKALKDASHVYVEKSARYRRDLVKIG
ncbi:carbonic anhydrase/acetyltransferase-like protein (isoleucine patch superfamily) [Rhizomicrobium palustre]|uniref:Carbonic anhydrase/acetyltransferase-like protein (Isoleucine patch superfamily) n=1 Tax=Rhizomicrobium palustre TaxID=189966 RepID=A0A846N4W0_9PROT|nr:gamma carbonic anhydrase family protein [Rhizomicrobium palustre]NIK90117.1 carbonic anhydrase/acetyltransferase-like protein (isoleucine patch superfamily) [Rhizomicrobium palustre]